MADLDLEALKRKLAMDTWLRNTDLPDCIAEIERLRLELGKAEQVLAQEKDTAASEIERWKAIPRSRA